MANHHQMSFSFLLLLGALISLLNLLQLSEARQVVIESTSSYDDDQRARISHCIHYINSEECKGAVQRIPASRGGSTGNEAEPEESSLESTTPLSTKGSVSQNGSQISTSTAPPSTETPTILPSSKIAPSIQLQNNSSPTTSRPKRNSQTTPPLPTNGKAQVVQLNNSTPTAPAAVSQLNGKNQAKSASSPVAPWKNTTNSAAHQQRQQKLRSELLPPMSQLPSSDNSTMHV